MFTGIIREIGVVVTARSEGGRAFAIRAPRSAPDLREGDSLSVDGVCLTVTSKAGDTVGVFASSETLEKTTLGSLSAGSRANLEPSLRAGDAIGGHLVTGHIDGAAVVVSFTRGGKSRILTVRPTADLLPEIVPRGSVALAGVSLTVYEVGALDFSVMLIPHTLEHTTLEGLAPGARANIETDILAKYVARRLAPLPGSGLTREFLAEHGFADRA